jgi:hypothetical protein
LICDADACEDVASKGFLMKIVEWNRFRNTTYQNDREAETIYIRDVAPHAAAAAASAPKEPERPPSTASST